MGRRTESVGDDGQIEETRRVIPGDDDLIEKPQLAVEDVIHVDLELLGRRMEHFVAREGRLSEEEE